MIEPSCALRTTSGDWTPLRQKRHCGQSWGLDMGTIMEVRWVHLSQGYFYYWPAGCVEEGRLLSSADGKTWEEVDLHLDPPKAIRYVRLVNDAARPWPMVVRQLEVYE